MSPSGRGRGEGWHELAEHVAETLDIGPGTSVLEVDCGSGEFLEPFYLNGYVVGGTDADAAAIDLAAAAMPDATFTVAEATAFATARRWDVIIWRSAGASPDLDTTPRLVVRMFANASHAIALLDLPEALHQPVLRALTEAGARAVQIESSNVFARV